MRADRLATYGHTAAISAFFIDIAFGNLWRCSISVFPPKFPAQYRPGRPDYLAEPSWLGDEKHWATHGFLAVRDACWGERPRSRGGEWATRPGVVGLPGTRVAIPDTRAIEL